MADATSAGIDAIVSRLVLFNGDANRSIQVGGGEVGGISEGLS